LYCEDHPADHNPGAARKAGEHCIEDVTANVVEINIDASWAMRV